MMFEMNPNVAEAYPYEHFQYHYLERYYHLTMAMRHPAIKASLERRTSSYDQAAISLFSIEPARSMADKLLFFFHGMDGDCADVVVARDLVERGNAKMVGVGGRGPGWLSDGFLGDAEQLIRECSSGWDGFYLSGVSMGGTQALSLASLLPDDMRMRIKGVLALIPGANVPAALERSSKKRVRDTIRASVHGDSAKARERSPHALIERLEAGIPFVITYNKNDSILLWEETEKYIDALSGRNPVSVFGDGVEHAFSHRNVDFVHVFRQMGVLSSVLKALPMKREVMRSVAGHDKDG